MIIRYDPDKLRTDIYIDPNYGQMLSKNIEAQWRGEIPPFQGHELLRAYWAHLSKRSRGAK